MSKDLPQKKKKKHIFKNFVSIFSDSLFQDRYKNVFSRCCFFNPADLREEEEEEEDGLYI